jgi:glutathione S-transferase
MYTLFYAPGSASMAPHAALEETGAPYQLKRVEIARDKPRDPEYLKLNPYGRVPTLAIKGEGSIYESAAITMFLADRHPQAKLAPAANEAARGPYCQWLTFLTNTLQEANLLHYYSDRYTTRADQAGGIKEKAGEQIDSIWSNIDQSLDRTGPYLLGDRFSAADLYLQMLYSWYEPLDKLAARCPNVKRCTDLVVQRPAVKRMLQQNDMAA